MGLMKKYVGIEE